VQFIIEIFLNETMAVVWTNFIVPLMVSSEVKTASNSVRKIVINFCTLQKDHDQVKYFLNAPDYLFVSTNVAKAYPRLMESILVQSYCNHHAGEIARKWNVVATVEEVQPVVIPQHTGSSTLQSAVRNTLVVGTTLLVLQNLCAAPPIFHRMFIRFVQPLGLSAIMFMWQEIIKTTAGIIVASILCGFGLIYLVYRQYKRRVAYNLQQKYAPHSDLLEPVDDPADQEPLENPPNLDDVKTPAAPRHREHRHTEVSDDDSYGEDTKEESENELDALHIERPNSLRQKPQSASQSNLNSPMSERTDVWRLAATPKNQLMNRFTPRTRAKKAMQRNESFVSIGASCNEEDEDEEGGDSTFRYAPAEHCTVGN
jgi:hypothetical protein